MRISKALLLVLSFLLVDNNVYAQIDTVGNPQQVGFCGVSPSYFAGGGFDTTITSQQNIAGPIGATNFPTSAIETCGRFQIYYEDMTLPYQAGFADPSVGATRRATLCSVLTYIQNTINFGNMANNEFIRIIVNKSLVPVNNASPNGTNWYAKARPDFSLNTPGVKNGWVFDFITTGNDPTSADQYHGELSVNFDKILFFQDMLTINWQNSISPVGDCQMDLYSVLLHEFGHILGFYTLLDHTIPTNQVSSSVTYIPSVQGGNIFTGLDYSIYVGNNNNLVNGSLQKLINTPLSNPSLNTNVSVNQVNSLWANNQLPPRNHPIFSGDTYDINNASNFPINSYGSHMADQFFGYTNRSRVSPGDRLEYVMGPSGLQGIERRTFTEAEINILRNLGDGVLGYQVTGNYLTNNTATLANTPPFSTKMIGYGLLGDWFFSETVLADAPPLVNDINAFVDINVSTDPTNIDPDNNIITIDPNSLINYRGCGSPGGNDHNRITIINNGTTIRFTPKPGFIGRAQFGLHLTDGIERGAFVIYTIDVEQGTNVPYVAGTTNMVVNGNYEDGSEVARVGPDEVKSNTTLSEYIHEGRLARAAHLTDGHPYSFVANHTTYGGGTMIQESFVECLSTVTPNVHTRKGELLASFPTTIYPQSFGYPNSNSGIRYQNFLHYNSFSFFNLKSEMVNCHRYRLEFDVYNGEYTDISFQVGFADANSINWPNNVSYFNYTPNLTFHTPINVNEPIGSWHHVVKEFYYCGANSNIMFLRNLTMNPNGGFQASKRLVDNIVLKEVFNANPSVSIIQTTLNNCQTELKANLSLVGCNPTFQWQLNNVNIPGATSSTYTFPSGIIGTYKVIVDDDCNPPYSNSINIVGYPCSQCAYFGTTGNSLSTTLSNQTIGAGNYYITNNTTITGNVTFQGSIVYVAPGVLITVGNGATLKLDGAHFFGCQDLWQGITLTGTGKFEGINNSLIEDAWDGVQSLNVNTGGSQFITSNNVIFNRNSNGITIQNMLAPQNCYSIKNTIFTSRDFTGYAGYPFNWPTAASLRNTSGVPGNVFEAPYAIKTYPSVDTKVNEVPTAGVKLWDVGTTTVSNNIASYVEATIGVPATSSETDFNVFDNLRNGIMAKRSNFSSVNNVFMLMRQQPLVGNNFVGGYGIYAYDDLPQFLNSTHRNRARLHIPSGSTQTNRFYDCFRAVDVENYWDIVGLNARIISNKLNNTFVGRGKYGYFVQTGSYLNMEINTNHIYNCETGIHINTSTAATNAFTRYIKVARNTIAPAEGTTSITNRSVLQAINVENMFSCTGCTWQTSTVNIDDNILKNVYNGVRIAGFKIQGSAASRNDIDLISQGSSTIPQFGVAQSANIGNWIYANDITGYSFASSADLTRGAYSDINQNDYVQCNTISTVGRNFEFNGNHSGFSRWWNNDILNGRRGFVLTNAALGNVGSATRPIDNRWLSVPFSGFVWSGNNKQTFTIGNSMPNSSRLFVKNTAPYVPTNNSNDFLFTSQIYNIGTSNGLFAASGAYLTPCDVQVKSKPTNPPVIVHAKIVSTDNESVGTWIAQYGLWRSLCLDTTLIDTFSELQEFYELGWQTRFQSMASIDSAFNEGDTALGRRLLADPGLMTPINKRGSAVELFDDNDVNKVIGNYKLFYELYLNYLDSNMTGSDSTLLDSLASLCTAKNGDAVIMARTLYHRVFNEMRIFDNQCPGDTIMADTTESGIGEGQGRYAYGKGEELGQLTPQGYQRYTLHPNPNNGNFNITQAVEDDKHVEMEIWNAVGAQVYKARLYFADRKAVVRVHGLSNGTYLLKLQDSKGYHYTVKFTIIQ